MSLAKLLRNICAATVFSVAGVSAVNYFQHHDKGEEWIYATIYTKMDGVTDWTEVTLTDDKTVVAYKSWLFNDVVLSDINLDGKVDGMTVINNGIIKYTPELSKNGRNNRFQETMERFDVR